MPFCITRTKRWRTARSLCCTYEKGNAFSAMLAINDKLRPAHLAKKINRLWQLSADKIASLEKDYDAAKGSPVFTIKGRYTARGWTEWTQGFQYGSAILQFDATGEKRFLQIGRDRTVSLMAPHVTHIGVHDH